MLDLRLLAGGALWILGLAICLAAYGYARWWAYQNNVRIRRVIGRPLFLIPLFVGLTVFCSGMALSTTRGWEIILWSVLAVLCAAQSVWICLVRQRDRRHGQDNPRQH